nr:hypothetical protein [Tanacetum cinerariifolium]
MKAVCPSVHIPSHEAIYADCVQLFMDEKLKLKSFNKSINSRVCLTLDTWTPSQYVNYLCINAHFIDDSWDKHKKIPSFTTLYSDEGEEMGKLVEKCLHDWEIDNVMTITTSVMTQSRAAILYVRQSSARTNAFKECAKESGIDFKHFMCLDCQTKWIRTFGMLFTSGNYEEAFKLFEIKDPTYKHFWKKLVGFRIMMIGKMHGSVLDPSSKTANIRTYYKRIYDQEDICDSDEDEVKDNESDYSLWKMIVRSVLDIVSDLFYEYKDNIGTLQRSENFQECLKKRNLDAEGNVLTETQLDRYLNEDTVKYDDDFDILLWWKNNTETFPVLSKIAKDVLAIPLSAVGSESAFKAKFETSHKSEREVKKAVQPNLTSLRKIADDSTSGCRTYYKRVYDQEDIFDLDEDQFEDDESDDSLWKATVRLVLNILYDLFYEYKDNIGTLQSENFQECLKKRKLDDAGNVATETKLDRYLNEDTVKYDDDLDILLWWKNNTETFSVLSKLQRMFWQFHCQPKLGAVFVMVVASIQYRAIADKESQATVLYTGEDLKNDGHMKSMYVEFSERLQDQLYINNYEKELIYLQLCEERDVHKEFDQHHLQWSDLDRVTHEMDELQMEFSSSKTQLERMDSDHALFQKVSKNVVSCNSSRATVD